MTEDVFRLPHGARIVFTTKAPSKYLHHEEHEEARSLLLCCAQR